MAEQQSKYEPSCAYTYTVRKRRGKADWAGVGIGDAFKGELDYFQRLPAQRAFYRLAAKAQRRVAGALGAGNEEEAKPLVKPELGPCYTNYPATLAAHAAHGLTAFREFQARSKRSILVDHMAGYLEEPAPKDNALADPAVYKRVARQVAETVQQRLVLVDLAKSCSLPAVEIYRLFSANGQSLCFHTVREVVQAVVLFGDVLPPWEGISLHPITRAMIQALETASSEFFRSLDTTPPERLLGLGVYWVRRVCKALDAYLPLPAAREQEPMRKAPFPGLHPNAARPSGEQPSRLAPPRRPEGPSEHLGPLEGLAPPALDMPASAGDHAARMRQAPGAGPGDPQAAPGPLNQEEERTLAEFSETMQTAAGQDRDWEQIRTDIVEQMMGQSPFQQGPISGSPTEGSEVVVEMAGGNKAGGEIFDRPLELSEDMQEVRRLSEQARPVTEELRRNLYPNLEHLPESLRLRCGGVLDGSRLALAGFCPTVFKRFRNMEVADRRGRSVLAIACDGSGSLNRDQMSMLKILATAWLESTVGSQIQILAGLYHSGRVRSGVIGPLVQWLYHPHKTPAMGRSDAVRAVASLPAGGTGVQSDALSVSFIMQEATRLAAGGMVYLIIISDTAWNRSFHGEMNGQEEMAALLGELRKERGHKLNAVLVALGVEGETGLESHLDKVITVSRQELENPATVASGIGEYVTACLRQRRAHRQVF